MRRLALGGALLLWVGCGIVTAPQEWDSQRGPVVPHDTFPADCSLCHLEGGWHRIRDDFTFDHGAETGVVLHGAHAHASCLRCHNDRGPVAAFAARGCAGCHVDPHRGELGASCADCHGEETWLPREAIARHARTRLPLTGAHAAVACFACHPGAQTGSFAGLDPRCHTCHQSDLLRARSPDHLAQGWTTDCSRCHVAIDWRPARFAHPASFPLSGGHAGLDCARCHGTSGSYGGLSPDCVSCHLDDYRNTRDPDHAAAGFSTDCTRCHTIRGWDGARFDHRFPIDSGRHSGIGCAECHTGAPSASNFSCTSCHAHTRAEMDDRHDEVGGYVYASSSCYACHPTGRS